MEADHPDLNGFVVAVFDAAHRSVQKATDGLTDQQLYYTLSRCQLHCLVSLAPEPMERQNQLRYNR